MPAADRERRRHLTYKNYHRMPPSQRQQGKLVSACLRFLPHEGELQSVELCQMRKAEGLMPSQPLRILSRLHCSYNQQSQLATLRLIPNTEMAQARPSLPLSTPKQIEF